MLFGVVIGLAGFFQSRDLNKKAIIDGKVFQVRSGIMFIQIVGMR